MSEEYDGTMKRELIAVSLSACLGALSAVVALGQWDLLAVVPLVAVPPLYALAAREQLRGPKA